MESSHNRYQLSTARHCDVPGREPPASATRTGIKGMNPGISVTLDMAFARMAAAAAGSLAQGPEMKRMRFGFVAKFPPLTRDDLSSTAPSDDLR